MSDKPGGTPDQRLQRVLDELDEWAASYPEEALEWLSTSATPSKITLEVEGATPLDKERGIEAAQAVFREANVSADEVAAAMYAFEGWDIDGLSDDEKPSQFDGIIMDLWGVAEQAALDACCTGWSPERLPASAVLQLAEDDNLTNPGVH